MSDEWKPVRSDALYPSLTEREEVIATLDANVRKLSSELASLKSGVSGRDVFVVWRGSVSDLATDLEPLLTLEQLQELACELALKWRERRTGAQGQDRHSERAWKLKASCVLEQTPPAVTIGQLCDRSGATRSDVVRFVRELVDQGLVVVAGEFVSKVAPKETHG